MTEAEQIMKRCQAGTRNYEEANNLHAACYRIIGKLLSQEKALQALHSENERLGLYKDAYAQRTWVDLTDEEIQVVAKQARSKDHAVTLMNKLLREKNT